MDETQRAEIKAQVQAYSQAWHEYGDIEDGKAFASASKDLRSLKLNQAQERMKEAMRLLNERGISEEMLVYDRKSRSYSLPPNRESMIRT